MYLIRTAGIETRCLSSRFRIPQMYLTRTAGIETSVTEIVQTRLIKCILPALRELKPGAFWRSRCARRMYLTRTAGIETGRKENSTFWVLPMYLTRTAGIFAFYSPIKNTSFGGTHRPEWRVFCSFFFILLVYEKSLPLVRKARPAGVIGGRPSRPRLSRHRPRWCRWWWQRFPPRQRR